MYVASILFFSREVSELAGKHRKEKIVHAPTKRMQSRWEKQKKMSRLIVICLVVVVVLVAGTIAAGIYLEQVAPYQKIVVKVNDKSFDFDYYIKTMDMFTQGVPKDSVPYYTDMVAQAIQQGEIVREKAADFGITATDEEVNKEIEQGNLPKDSVAATDLARVRLLTKKYIDKVCLPKQPASVQQAEVEAMFLETKDMVADRKQHLLLGDNFTNIAGQLSIETTTRNKKGYLGWIPKGYESYALGDLKGSTLKDVIFTLEPKTYSDAIYDPNVSKPFGYWVLQVLEKDPSKGIHGRGILLPTREQADDVRAKLINGGSWDELAKQYSQAPSATSGGDLGWVQVANDTSMLPRILSGQESNKISDVIRDESVQTKGGYWLVQVMNIQDRPLVDSIKQTLTQECLGAWVQGLMKDVKTETLLDDAQKTLAATKVTKNRSK
jgi:parvulin-like peptidyl-prolyl isomerase